MMASHRSLRPWLTLLAWGVPLACSGRGKTGSEVPTAEPTGVEATAADSEHTSHEQGPNAEHRHAHGMPHRFQDAEAWAEQFDNPRRAQWQKPDEVVDWLKLNPEDRVGDLGAGTGYFTVRLARAVPRGMVFASDIEPGMVQYLRERSAEAQLDNVTPVLGTADDPRIPEPVDVIFLCNVYHHVQDRPSYFAELQQSLRKGGRLVVVDFKVDAPHDAPGPPREHRVSVRELATELAAAGYEEQRIDVDLLPFQYVAEFTVN